VVLGDQRKFPIILIVPNLDQLERWAKERNLTYGSPAELIRLPDAQAKMEREVMGGLRDLAKFEMPKKVVLIERDFTIESGELTPSLKVKRRQVEKNYKDLIDRVYAEADPTAAGHRTLISVARQRTGRARAPAAWRPAGAGDALALDHQPPPREQHAPRPRSSQSAPRQSGPTTAARATVWRSGIIASHASRLRTGSSSTSSGAFTPTK